MIGLLMVVSGGVVTLRGSFVLVRSSFVRVNCVGVFSHEVLLGFQNRRNHTLLQHFVGR